MSGASITILSTIVMSIVLESIGFFQWAAVNMIAKANGSGITSQQIPYLLSGALVATVASAPIGVSNLANLIALKIVNMDLNDYAAMMFVPSMIGIATMALLLFCYFRNEIPKRISASVANGFHPLIQAAKSDEYVDWWMFRACMLIVVLTRGSFFILSSFEIPVEIPALLGALTLILIRWFRTGTGAADIVSKTPWHILLFAFSMYVVVYGLRNSGLIGLLLPQIEEYVAASRFHAIFIMGILLTLLSNLCNNLPAVTIGTLSLTTMDLDLQTLQLAYLANIIGSDVGSLITPMGTLASLIWMFILKRNRIPMTWGLYLRVTIMVIPITLLVSLLSLYGWTEWLFF